MNPVLCVFMGMIALVFILLLGYDAVYSLIEKYSHFHIGRWDSQAKWKAAVEKKAKKWLLHTPILRIRDDNRYLLIDTITGKSGKNMVQSWQKAGCLMGVSALDLSDKCIEKAKKQLIDDTGNWKIPVNKIDYALLAYSILKTEADAARIKPAMDSVIACIENNLCPDGMVSYSGGKDTDRRYVDTLGFVCPFLSLYGVVYDRPEYVKMAVDQIRLFDASGFYMDLPAHCFQTGSNVPLGIYGWGRGMGWYSLALIETYRSVRLQSDKDFLLSRMNECAEKWKRYERLSGGFSTIAPVTQGHYDSSATVMLGYLYAVCGNELNNETYRSLAQRCLEQLKRHTKINGTIDGCLGDTIDLGVFSQRYGSMPFVQGLALTLYAELNKE